jgi:Pyruvate/2-oxoacid:ferredoxin oxidoreductase delta subunit
MTSYEIIENAIRNYWLSSYPQPVVAFFHQKYECEDTWEWCEELATPNDPDGSVIIFQNDFCEGQTCVANIIIIPLSDITKYYSKHFLNLHINGMSYLDYKETK